MLLIIRVHISAVGRRDEVEQIRSVVTVEGIYLIIMSSAQCLKKSARYLTVNEQCSTKRNFVSFRKKKIVTRQVG